MLRVTPVGDELDGVGVIVGVTDTVTVGVNDGVRGHAVGAVGLLHATQ